jgi:hypothetical protein
MGGFPENCQFLPKMCSKKGGKQENCLFPPIKIRSFEGVKRLICPYPPTLFLAMGVTCSNHPFPPTKPAKILPGSPGYRQTAVEKQVVVAARHLHSLCTTSFWVRITLFS